MNSPTPVIVSSYPIRHATISTDDVADQIMALLTAGVWLIDLSDHDRHAHTVHVRVPGEDHDDQ
jgi:hypothetical protein